MMQGTLPRDALGVGLRAPHYAFIHQERPAVDYFEAISENYLGAAGPPLEHLDRVVRHYPVVLHGVGLNLLGTEGPDPDYLRRLKDLADRVRAPFVSDHLCWTRAGAVNHHDLLPVPMTRDLIPMAAERAAMVADFLERPFALENLSSYTGFERSEMEEWEFYGEVVEKAGCFFMLDVNNIYVSSVNHGFDADRYLAAIDFDRVIQVHLAGHQCRPDGLIVDTHDGPVADSVLSLYKRAWETGGPFPTLLEWDDRIPSFEQILAELAVIRGSRS